MEFLKSARVCKMGKVKNLEIREIMREEDNQDISRQIL